MRLLRRLTILLPAAMLSACVTSWEPQPPPQPQPRPQPTYVPAHMLVQRCREVAPQVHPWRGRQIRSALLQYELSRAYRRGAEQMKPRDRQRAEAQEREAWSILWETCQPVLATAPRAP
ncbi:MAG TPA: hypothetical protein VGE22_07760 [Solimonas sp.]